MSKYVLVSDIHGNALSLQAVLQEEGFDATYLVLGDLMGLLAYPSEVVEILQGLNGHVILGNHDKSLIEYNKGHVVSDELSAFEYEHTLNQLSDKQIEWMKDLGYFKVLTDSGERLCMTHAMPFPEKASGYEAENSGVSKRDLIEIASVVSDDYSIVTLGHTHEQYEQDCSKFGQDILFINPGSVGYDGNYAVVDTDVQEVELKSVDPKLDEVKEHIKEVLPEDCPNVEKWL